jgi:oxygen-dependent protoporphyrinogen oxidase
VTHVFRAEDLPDRLFDMSGFLVPPVEQRAIKASTFSFAKWAWVRDLDPGLVALRTSLGRHGEEAALQAPDEGLVRVSLGELAALAGITAAPVDSHVQRWGGGLPQYAVGHLDRVARVRTAVAAVPGLAVCGAAYDGVGIPAVIGSARRAVTWVTGAQ